jgi:hypothetical protein
VFGRRQERGPVLYAHVEFSNYDEVGDTKLLACISIARSLAYEYSFQRVPAAYRRRGGQVSDCKI